MNHRSGNCELFPISLQDDGPYFSWFAVRRFKNLGERLAAYGRTMDLEQLVSSGNTVNDFFAVFLGNARHQITAVRLGLNEPSC